MALFPERFADLIQCFQERIQQSALQYSTLRLASRQSPVYLMTFQTTDMKFADIPGIRLRLITTSKNNLSEIHIPRQRSNNLPSRTFPLTFSLGMPSLLHLLQTTGYEGHSVS